MEYNEHAVEIQESEAYAKWFEELRDRRAQHKILARIRRLSQGNPGDVAPIGEGVSEMRIDYGPGYRVYFLERGRTLIILLAGGDKHTQKRDIRRAIALARRIKELSNG